MREVIVSPTVLGKLSDLVSYLKDDITRIINARY